MSQDNADALMLSADRQLDTIVRVHAQHSYLAVPSTADELYYNREGRVLPIDGIVVTAGLTSLLRCS